MRTLSETLLAAQAEVVRKPSANIKLYPIALDPTLEFNAENVFGTELDDNFTYPIPTAYHETSGSYTRQLVYVKNGYFYTIDYTGTTHAIYKSGGLVQFLQGNDWGGFLISNVVTPTLYYQKDGNLLANVLTYSESTKELTYTSSSGSTIATGVNQYSSVIGYAGSIFCLMGIKDDGFEFQIVDSAGSLVASRTYVFPGFKFETSGSDLYRTQWATMVQTITPPATYNPGLYTIYFTQPDGSVGVIQVRRVSTTGEIYLSDITIGLPADLSTCYITHSHTSANYTAKNFVYGIMTRTKEMNSGRYFVIRMEANELASGGRTILSINPFSYIHNGFIPKTTDYIVKIKDAVFKSWADNPNDGFYLLGSGSAFSCTVLDDNYMTFFGSYPNYLYLSAESISGSSRDGWTVVISDSSGSASSNALTREGTGAIINIGYQTTVGTEAITYDTCIVSKKSEDFSDGNYKLILNLMSSGLYRSELATHPLYQELKSKSAYYDDCNEVDFLYTAPNQIHRAPHVNVDFWTDLDSHIDGGYSAGSHAESETVIVKIPSVKDAGGLYDDPWISGDLVIKIYGWSRPGPFWATTTNTALGLPNDTFTPTLNFRKLDGTEYSIQASTLSSGSANPPCEWPDVKLGSYPVVWEVTTGDGLIIGSQLISVEIAITSTSKTVFCLERLQIYNARAWTLKTDQIALQKQPVEDFYFPGEALKYSYLYGPNSTEEITGLVPGTLYSIESSGSMISGGSSVDSRVFLMSFDNASWEGDINLVQNSEMESTTNWSVAGTTTISCVTSAASGSFSKCLRVTQLAGSYTNSIYQTGLSIISGRSYRIVFLARSISGNTSLTVDLHGSLGTTTVTLYSAWLKYAATITATSTGTIYFWLSAAGTYEIDEVRVYEQNSGMQVPSFAEYIETFRSDSAYPAVDSLKFNRIYFRPTGTSIYLRNSNTFGSGNSFVLRGYPVSLPYRTNDELEVTPQRLTIQNVNNGSLMFAQKPYDAKNFYVEATFYSSGSFAYPGILALAEDGMNFVMLQKNTDDTFHLYHVNRTYPFTNDLVASSVQSVTDIFTMSLMHKNGLFTARYKNNLSDTWITLFEYSWTTEDAPLFNGTVANIGARLIDYPSYYGEICSFAPDRSKHIALRPKSATDLSTGIASFASAGSLSIQGNIYTYKSKTASTMSAAGPFQFRNFETNKYYTTPNDGTVYDYRIIGNSVDLLWYQNDHYLGNRTHCYDYKDYLLAITNGLTVKISKSDWKVFDTVAGVIRWIKNRSRHYSTEITSIWDGSCTDKVWVTQGFLDVKPVNGNVDGVFHPEGTEVYPYTGAEKLWLLNFWASDDSNSFSLSDLIEISASVANAQIDFPGDTYGSINEYSDPTFTVENIDNTDFKFEVNPIGGFYGISYPANNVYEIKCPWTRHTGEAMLTKLIIKATSPGFTIEFYDISPYDEEISANVFYDYYENTTDRIFEMRIFIHGEFISIWNNGEWIKTSRMPQPHLVRQNKSGVIWGENGAPFTFTVLYLANSSITYYLRELGEWREAIFVDMEQTPMSAIQNIIQQRPISISTTSDGKIRFFYDFTRAEYSQTTNLKRLTSDKEIPRDYAMLITAYYADVFTKYIEIPTGDRKLFIQKVLRIPDIAATANKVVYIKTKRMLESFERTQLEIAGDLRIEIDDVFNVNKTLPNGKVINKSIIIEEVRTSLSDGIFVQNIVGRRNLT